MPRRRLLFVAQCVFSVALLIFLAFRVDVGGAMALAMNADKWLLALAVLQLAGQPFLAGWRWKIVADRLGGALPFALAVRYSWIGAFFSQVLPASVGGDAVRMWLHWTYQRSRRLAVHSVAFERVVMVIALLVYAIALQPWFALRGVPPAIVYAAAVAVCIAVLGVALLLLFHARLAAYQHVLPLRLLANAGQDVRLLLTDLPAGALLVAVCIASYLNMAVSAWLIGRALGVGLPFVDCALLFPLVVLAATLPVSVGGWGVRESAAIGVFGLAGVQASGALALSVVFGVVSIAVSLPGALLWLNRERRAGEDDMAMDEVR
jgi:uncharacterized membrane protein YbhN (UPF0104 family)